MTLGQFMLEFASRDVQFGGVAEFRVAELGALAKRAASGREAANLVAGPELGGLFAAGMPRLRKAGAAKDAKTGRSAWPSTPAPSSTAARKVAASPPPPPSLPAVLARPRPGSTRASSDSPRSAVAAVDAQTPANLDRINAMWGIGQHCARCGCRRGTCSCWPSVPLLWALRKPSPCGRKGGEEGEAELHRAGRRETRTEGEGATAERASKTEFRVVHVFSAATSTIRLKAKSVSSSFTS